MATKIKSKIEKEEIFAEIYPDMKGIEIEDREEVMEEIGEYLLSEIFDYLAEGVSPVTGTKFQKLKDKYAEREKLGDQNPNLDLNGDMLRALEYEVQADKILLGILDNEDQAVKAYAHNTGFKGHPFIKGPKRKFIPEKNELFAKDIMAGIEEIIEDFKLMKKEERDEGEDVG